MTVAMAGRSGLPKNRTSGLATAASIAALVVALVEGWALTAVLAIASAVLWCSLLVIGVRRRRARASRRLTQPAEEPLR
jgi:hypothetical protein